MTIAELQQAALDLPIEERLRLVEVLWESLESQPVALPAWQEELLDQRLADLKKHPRRGASWEEVEKRIWPEDD